MCCFQSGANQWASSQHHVFGLSSKNSICCDLLRALDEVWWGVTRMAPALQRDYMRTERRALQSLLDSGASVRQTQRVITEVTSWFIMTAVSSRECEWDDFRLWSAWTHRQSDPIYTIQNWFKLQWEIIKNENTLNKTMHLWWTHKTPNY